jgi:8-hydroxy-5-deazaflavin:NADPH oxidoreductase
MKIGIIGTGNMGRSLGLLWAAQGHEVIFGARDASKAKSAATLSPHGATAGTNDEAAAFGELVFYNIRDVAPADVLSDPSVLDGKIVIESNNSPVPADLNFPPTAMSRSEQLQAQIPQARVVKAFNTIPVEVFEYCPHDIREHRVSVYIAGDDPAARDTVSSLVSEIGFEPLDCGALRLARLLEPVADFFRAVLIPKQMFAALSVHELPIPDQFRLGGREAGVDSQVVAEIMAS